MRLFRTALFPAVAISALASLAMSGTAAAQTDSTVKTDSTKLMVNMDQGLRGRETFNKTCLECHTKTDVTGADFKIKWSTRPVWELYDVIKTTMPDDKPGSLTPDQYIDVVSYLLRINGAAFGGQPLVAADTAGLKKAKIEITVPSPNADSTQSAIRVKSSESRTSQQLSSRTISTPARVGITHLFTRQASNKH